MKELPTQLKLLQETFFKLIDEGKLIDARFGLTPGKRWGMAIFIFRGLSSSQLDTIETALQTDVPKAGPRANEITVRAMLSPDNDGCIEVPDYFHTHLETGNCEVASDFVENLREAMRKTHALKPELGILRYAALMNKMKIHELCSLLESTNSAVTPNQLQCVIEGIIDEVEGDIGLYTARATARNLHDYAKTLAEALPAIKAVVKEKTQDYRLVEWTEALLTFTQHLAVQEVPLTRSTGRR